MTNKRERRPSMAQRPILVAIADLIEQTAQPARHADVTDLILQRGERYPQVAQWAAIGEFGAQWVEVDRGTEDNRGGIQSEYRYTLTPAGWAAIDRQPPAPACSWYYAPPEPGCDNDAEPGSEFCGPHREQAERLQALSDDMDRLEASASSRPTYNPETDRYEGPDGKEDSYRRHLRRVEESSAQAFWGD